MNAAWEQHVDVHDMVRELTEPIQHREAHDRDGRAATEYHTTTSPSLVAQLRAAGAASGSGAGGLRPGFESKPTARIDALDVLIRIDHDAARWVRRLGEDDAGSTETCIRRSVALSVSAHPGDASSIGRDVKRWWTWARMTTGWETPPWQPANTCPLCGQRGGLRVRVDERIGLCVNCGEAWEPDTIGLLVDHIRGENNDPETPALTPSQHA